MGMEEETQQSSNYRQEEQAASAEYQWTKESSQEKRPGVDRQPQGDNPEDLLQSSRRLMAEVTANDVTPNGGSDSASHTGDAGVQYAATTPNIREVKADGFEKKYVTDVGGPASQTAQRSDEQFILDVRNAFSGIPQVKKQWRENFFKIMVVGESGLGKTTFIKNLFASFAQDPDLEVNDASDPTSRDLFIETPDKLMTEIVVKDNTNMINFHYRIQDTPGHDMQEDADCILQYVKDQYREFLTREQDARRTGPLQDFEDPRVDVALYFLSPHRVKNIDVQFVGELSNLVPVIPCLAKADSMTQSELKAYREVVRGAFTKGHAQMYTFSKEMLEEAGIRREVPPFAIVASRTADMNVGKFWPVRKYPWGTCEAMSSQHSDLAVLKKLLFEVAFEDLKAQTDRRYYNYRAMQMLQLEEGGTPMDRDMLSQKIRQLVEVPQPKSRNDKLIEWAGTASKYIGAGIAFYVATAIFIGGGKRLRKDLEVVKEKAVDAAGTVAEAVVDAAGTVVDVTGEAAHVLADKAGDAAGYVADKAGDAASVVADKAGDALDAAGDVRDTAVHKTTRAASKAARKAGVVKDAALEKVAGGAEPAARRAEEAAAEERRKHKRGFFHWGRGGDD